MTYARGPEPAPTVPLVVPAEPPVGEQRFADLPSAPAAYHRGAAAAQPRRRGRPLHPQEWVVLGVLVTLVVLVVAKALVDENGADTNVVDLLLYAVLAALVGIAVVGVGGGLIVPMRHRWTQLLDDPGPRPGETSPRAGHAEPTPAAPMPDDRTQVFRTPQV